MKSELLHNAAQRIDWLTPDGRQRRAQENISHTYSLVAARNDTFTPIGTYPGTPDVAAPVSFRTPDGETITLRTITDGMEPPEPIAVYISSLNREWLIRIGQSEIDN